MGFFFQCGELRAYWLRFVLGLTGVAVKPEVNLGSLLAMDPELLCFSDFGFSEHPLGFVVRYGGCWWLDLPSSLSTVMFVVVLLDGVNCIVF